MKISLKKLFGDKAEKQTPEMRLYKALSDLSLACHSYASKQLPCNRQSASDKAFALLCRNSFQFEITQDSRFDPIDSIIRLNLDIQYRRPERFAKYMTDERAAGTEDGKNFDRMIEKLPEFEKAVKTMIIENPPLLIDRVRNALAHFR